MEARGERKKKKRRKTKRITFQGSSNSITLFSPSSTLLSLFPSSTLLSLSPSAHRSSMRAIIVTEHGPPSSLKVTEDVPQPPRKFFFEMMGRR